MNRRLALLAMSCFMVSSMPEKAMSFDLCLTPYVGVDAQVRNMGFKKEYGGGPLFNNNYPQGNLFVGAMFNDYVGVEGGFEFTQLKSKEATQVEGQQILGYRVEFPAETITVKAQNRLYGWNVNLIGAYPICNAYRISIIGSIGLARLRSKLDACVTGSEGISQNRPCMKFPGQTKSILRLTAGLKHMITDCIGIRGTIGWENTSKFNKLTATTLQDIEFLAKYKDSIQYGFGLFINF